MIAERITDPTEISASLIDQLISEKGGAVIQFSMPPQNSRLLRDVDVLCKKHGDALEVRFYGYYNSQFDDSVLRHLPSVRNLSLDCLMRAESLNGLFGLTRLTKLSLGIFELKDPSLLTKIGIRHLNEFSIGETRSGKIDLSPLVQCQDLAVLRIEAQPHGMEVVQDLPNLKDLTLRRIGKAHSFAFVSKIRELKRLKVILGGRTDVHEVNHPGLEQLEIVWVRGLADLGNLGRFPSLRKLWVEDQLQLKEINLETAPAGLRHLTIFNCKNLCNVGSLANLTSLEDVRIARTAIGFDDFVSSLPRSIRTVRFFDGKQRRDAEIRRKLESLGYASK